MLWLKDDHTSASTFEHSNRTNIALATQSDASSSAIEENCSMSPSKQATIRGGSSNMPSYVSTGTGWFRMCFKTSSIAIRIDNPAGVFVSAPFE